jgi:hypothetical protein
MKAPRNEVFLRRLVEKFPELLPVLEEHLNENLGELLPHLLLADIKRHLVAAYEAERGIPNGQVGPILDYLEEEFRTGDEEMKELIAVSFLELLPDPDEPGGGIRDLLGPSLAAQADREP